MSRKRHNTPFVFSSSPVVHLKKPKPEKVMKLVMEEAAKIHYEPASEFRITPKAGIERPGGQAVGNFSRYGFGRLCTALEIPAKFVRSLAEEDSDLSAEVINRRITARARDYQFAFRGSVVEGVVTSRYGSLTNHDVADMVTELGEQMGEIERFALEGLRMRLNTIQEGKEIRPQGRQVNDIVKGGIEVYNAEDGGAAFNVTGWIYRLICSNGMVAREKESLGRVVHRGTGLTSRALVALQRAADSSTRYFPLIQASVKRVLNKLDQEALAKRTANQFSVAFSNAVLDGARDEQAKWHREDMRLYDFWNGVTRLARDAHDLQRSRDVERYAAEVLTYDSKAA